MFSCLQILEAFLWFVLITLLNVTLIILTLSVSRLLNLLLRLVAFLLFLNPQCLASISRWITASSSWKSSKGPKPLQLKLLTTYIPKTSAFTLAFSTSQRLRTTRASARTFFTFRHYITQIGRASCGKSVDHGGRRIIKKKQIMHRKKDENK